MAFFKKEIKKLYHDVKMEVEVKPEIYKVVKRLNIEIDAEVQRGMLPTDIQDAAKQLYAKLRNAMNRFDQKTEQISGGLVYKMELQNFAQECHSAIFSHQPTLMAAPGLWNQIKAHINNFLEQYFAIDPILDTDKSVLGLKQDCSNSFDNVKIVLKPQSEEESCCYSLQR